MEDFITEYNALCRCLVIDARHGSRQQLMKFLFSGQLFDDIVDAKSLDGGKQFLKMNQTDACVIGPSTTVSTGLKFIAEMSKSAFSEDCAYLAIVESGSDSFEQYANGGAHWVLETGYSRKSLFEAIINAVVRANENSPWRGVLISQLEAKGISIEDLFPTRAAIDHFKDFFEDESFKSDPLFADAAEKIRKLVNQLLSGHESPERRAFLEKLIHDWKDDVQNYSIAVANDLFQTKLKMLIEKDSS